MKFPITREMLQAFCPEKDMKERNEIAVENSLNSLINSICNNFETSIVNLDKSYNGLDYNYMKNYEETQKKILTEKRFIYEFTKIHTKNGPVYLNTIDSALIDRLVYKLAEKFIGCDIIIDPLKTYIIIDWS